METTTAPTTSSQCAGCKLSTAIEDISNEEDAEKEKEQVVMNRDACEALRKNPSYQANKECAESENKGTVVCNLMSSTRGFIPPVGGIRTSNRIKDICI